MQTRRSLPKAIARLARPSALVLAPVLALGVTLDTAFASPPSGALSAQPAGTSAALGTPTAAPMAATAIQARERMGAFTGQSPRAIPAELRRRARFVGRDLATLEQAPDDGCVVMQSPAPGDELGADTPIAFLVASSVPTPDFHGLSLAAAQALAEHFCLSVAAVPSCEGADNSTGAAAPDSIVDTQCTPPDSIVDIGNQIGVVVSPADDPQPLMMGLFVLAATVALLATALALLFYARYASARDELAIFKSPKRDK
jgi:hypothetical protein